MLRRETKKLKLRKVEYDLHGPETDAYLHCVRELSNFLEVVFIGKSKTPVINLHPNGNLFCSCLVRARACLTSYRPLRCQSGTWFPWVGSTSASGAGKRGQTLSRRHWSSCLFRQSHGICPVTRLTRYVCHAGGRRRKFSDHYFDSCLHPLYQRENVRCLRQK